MKNSLIAYFILFFSLSFSQDLFVDTGSYVFVDGTAFTSGPTVAPLYVTNDIELAGNGNIYLRNEAQLLQGAGTITSTNTGEGQLSVYQEGNVNKWAYNYWCSPVGNNSAVLGNENARVELLKDATNIASPGDPMGLTAWADAIFIDGYDGIASPLTISRRWLWTYQSSILYADWDFVGEALPILPGLGFTMKGTSDNPIIAQNYDFRGKPNNGTISNTVGVGEFTLVGNPYPSALDAQLYINDLQNLDAITGTLFYWEQDTNIESHVLDQYIGGYAEYTIDNMGNETFTPARFATYDGAGNVVFVPPGPPGGTKTATKYIPVGQGFMVEGRVGTSGTIRAKNSHRSFEKKGINSSFFKDNYTNVNHKNTYSLVNDDYRRFRINVDFTINNNQFTRQVVLNFHNTATAGFDYGMELSRSENFSSDTYFSFENKSYSAQAYPFEETLKIPLVVDIEQEQPLTFRIFDIQNFEESQGIYIHDKENDIYVNLRNLNYDLNIEPGNYTDRFEIVFTSETALDVDEFDVDTLTINQNNGIHQLTVLNPKNLDISAIEVYDITGKRLLHDTFDTILNRYEFSTTDLSDGVYIVNVQAQTSVARSQKILVKN